MELDYGLYELKLASLVLNGFRRMSQSTSIYIYLSKQDKDAMRQFTDEYHKKFTVVKLGIDSWHIVDLLYAGRWKAEFFGDDEGVYDFWDEGIFFKPFFREHYPEFNESAIYHHFMKLMLDGKWK